MRSSLLELSTLFNCFISSFSSSSIIHPAFLFFISSHGVLFVVKTGNPQLNDSKITYPKFSLFEGKINKSNCLNKSILISESYIAL